MTTTPPHTLLMLLPLLLAACLATEPPPGLLVLVTDTTRGDLMGAAMPDITGQGRRYTNAWAAASYTTASTVTLASGRWPIGDERDVPVPHAGPGPRQFRLTASRWPGDAWVEAAGGTVLTDQPLVRIMRSEGVGGDWGHRPGSPDLIAEATEWIRQQREPWVLYVHAAAAHSPYDGFPGTLPGQPFSADRQSTPMKMFGDQTSSDAGRTPTVDPDVLAWARWQYRSAVEATLHGVDHLVRAVPAGTTVLWTADHGEAFGEDGLYGHGSGLNDAQVHVPLVVWGPGVEPGVDETPVPATCVGKTASRILGLVDYGCDLRTGEIDGFPVVGKLSGDTHGRTASGTNSWVTRTWGQPWDAAMDPDQP